MEAYKSHKYFIFNLDDGKVVKYDLSNGEVIGKRGKPVKSLNEQLKGYNLNDVINSFKDEHYRKFLRFINDKFVNLSADGDVIERVTNIGTFLSKVNNYNKFEQYFASGIYNVSKDLTYNLSDIPKHLAKLCRKYNIFLDDSLVRMYNHWNKEKTLSTDLFISLISMECISITHQEISDLLCCKRDSYHIGWSDYYDIIEVFRYNQIAFIKYLDHLITYEALDLYSILRELKDYCRMMNRISPKFDKYPRNFLTTHQIAVRNYNRLKEQFDEQAFERRINSEFEWKKDDYIIMYPKTVQDIKDEATQQNNCVASYVKRVIDGECHILFMRKKDEVEKSLVTVEVRDNKVVQALGRFNRDLYPEERIVINKYNTYLNKQNNMECLV